MAALSKALEAIGRRPLQKVAAERMDRQLDALRRELVKKQEIRDSLYRRYAASEVPQEDFYEFKRIFTRDCEEVEQAIEAQQRQLDELMEATAPDSPWIKYFKHFGQLESLKRETLVRLVERVLIYEDARVEIVFRYQEQFAQAMTVAAGQVEDLPMREAV